MRDLKKEIAERTELIRQGKASFPSWYHSAIAIIDYNKVVTWLTEVYNEKTVLEVTQLIQKAIGDLHFDAQFWNVSSGDSGRGSDDGMITIAFNLDKVVYTVEYYINDTHGNTKILRHYKLDDNNGDYYEYAQLESDWTEV